jgi:hypothetical protein
MRFSTESQAEKKEEMSKAEMRPIGPGPLQAGCSLDGFVQMLGRVVIVFICQKKSNRKGSRLPSSNSSQELQ